jgi:hypothetical protein
MKSRRGFFGVRFTKQSKAKPNSPNQSFFHPLGDIYVSSVARNETFTVQGGA